MLLDVGLGAEADIEKIPDPITKTTFAGVQKLKNTKSRF